MTEFQPALVTEAGPTIYEPVKVHVIQDDSRQPPKFRDVISKTYLASSTVPELIAGRAMGRKLLYINVIASQATQQTTPAINQIPLGANGVASYNNNSVGVNQTISGGTVTAIAINGTTTGLTSGVFFVPAGGTVTVTYSVAPSTFTTAGIAVTSPVTTANVVLCDTQADAISAARWTQVGTIAGTVLQAGQQEQLFHTDEVWLVCLPNGTPPLVSTTTEFERDYRGNP